jgi:hypothetical protein
MGTIENAVVTLTLDGTIEQTLIQTTSSNSTVFAKVPFGTYYVNVALTGYHTDSIHSLTVSNKNVSIEIPLFVGDDYSVGDSGPAEGKIFYDKGEYSKGWRYLEVSPAEHEFTAEWGTHGSFLLGTRREIGSGRANTMRIVLRCLELEETEKAAQLCMNLNINGFRDWFLPSRDELIEMHRLSDMIGGFIDERYWSSEQENAVGAWFHDFETGFPSAHFKNEVYRVRAVRAF